MILDYIILKSMFFSYHKSTIRKENRTLGDSVVHLRDMDPERPTLMNLKLVDPSTGSFNGGEVWSFFA